MICSSQILIVFQCMLRPVVVESLPVLPIAMNLSNTGMNSAAELRVPEEATHELLYPHVPPDIPIPLEENMLREALRTLDKSDSVCEILSECFDW